MIDAVLARDGVADVHDGPLESSEIVALLGVAGKSLNMGLTAAEGRGSKSVMLRRLSFFGLLCLALALYGCLSWRVREPAGDGDADVDGDGDAAIDTPPVASYDAGLGCGKQFLAERR